MPHYHNFSWYYFLKYVVGFAGMLFLYSGLLKEKTFPCVCAPVDKEIARRKGENNESSPTGGTTDARAKRDVYIRSRVPVDVEGECTHPAMPTTRQRKVEETIAPRKGRKAKYETNDDLQAYRAKVSRLSSSDVNIQFRKRKRHRPDRRLALKHRQCLVRNTSSHSLQSVACLKVECKNNCDRKIFDAVARANLRVRSSFEKQEHLELEAFACLITNQGIKPHFAARIAGSSSSSNPDSFQTEESPTSVDEIDDEEYSSSDNPGYPDCNNIRCRAPFRTCNEHYPDCPSTSFASVKSRSGSFYFTASSRGKKLECQIHGRRCSKTSDEPGRIRQRCRIIEESDESNDEIMRKKLTIEKRKIGNRRAARYRSRCN